MRILLLLLIPIYTLFTNPVVGQTIEFAAIKQVPEIGNTRSIHLQVSNFSDITTLQFTLQWNPALLQFSSLSNFNLPSLSSANFNTGLTSSGKLTFSWDDASLKGISLANNSAIFTINFLVTQPLPAGTVLSFTSSPTPIEVTRQLKNVNSSFRNALLSDVCNCK